MKLQSLAIIFIIIVLPISLVLSSYMETRIKTLSLQLEYDKKLENSTYDAIRAFQINSLNSSTSDLADSKLRDIRASVNAFYNSMQSNFDMNGYDKTSLQNHIPALVYTLYDGYYIYSPYYNVKDYTDATNDNMTMNEISNDLKPYVYYSCRYKKGNIDVVITYSLDSYVTIRGKKGTDIIDLKGYLLSNVEYEGSKIKYNDCIIEEEALEEYVILNGEKQSLPYYKNNGVKFYYDKSQKKYYTMSNGNLEYRINFPLNDDNLFEHNNSAKKLYENAIYLRNKIREYGLDELHTNDAVDENGEKLVITTGGRISYI